MRWISAFFCAFVFLCACSQPVPALPVVQIVIDTDAGPHTFTVEIAADEAARAHGLMERTDLPADNGMLFDYHAPANVAFWMKNTPLPLDMIFIRADGTISTIVAETIPYSETPIPSSEPVQAVLEINGGRAAELGIHPGDRVHAAIFRQGR
jgi:uncharacterized protein